MSEVSNDGKMPLPVVHEVCPVCGSKKRLGEALLQQLREEGVIHKDSFPGGLEHRIPLMDPEHPPVILGPTINLRVMIVSWDICECGIMYCTKFEIVEMSVPVQMQRGQTPPGFRGFPGKAFPHFP